MPPTQEPVTSVLQQESLPQHPSHRPWIIAVGIVAALLVLAVASALVWAPNSFFRTAAVENIQPKKIGILSMRQFNDVVVGFKAEMNRLGYTDAVYEEIPTDPSPTLMQDIDSAVRRLVDSDVDAIWTSLEQQAKGAVDITKELGRTDIPVVFMTRFHDPVEYGIIDSFRSSGNNSTGVATDLREIMQRTLQFFKDIDPSIKRIAVFSDGYMVPGVGEEYFATLKTEAPKFGMEVVEYKTKVPPPQVESEFNRVAATIKKGEFDAIFHIPGHFYNLQEAGEGKLAVRLGIPMAAPYEDLPNGGIFTYSDDFGESGKATAVILDKIFRGTKPSDIPVAYGGNNILTLMMGRAKDAGLVFPESMLFIAKNKFEAGSSFEADSLVHEQK